MAVDGQFYKVGDRTAFHCFRTATYVGTKILQFSGTSLFPSSFSLVAILYPSLTTYISLAGKVARMVNPISDLQCVYVALLTV